MDFRSLADNADSKSIDVSQKEVRAPNVSAPLDEPDLKLKRWSTALRDPEYWKTAKEYAQKKKIGLIGGVFVAAYLLLWALRPPFVCSFDASGDDIDRERVSGGRLIVWSLIAAGGFYFLLARGTIQ